MKTYLINLLVFSSFILVLFLTSCKNESYKPSTLQELPIAWGDNHSISYNNDTVLGVYYDTIEFSGPFKYGNLTHGGRHSFFGEPPQKKSNETHLQFIKRLKKSMDLAYETCHPHCGDANFYNENIQNLEIINIYSLIKENEIDSAIYYLEKHTNKKWYGISRYQDLYIGLLLKKIGRKEIERQLASYTSIHRQDSIQLNDIWIKWDYIRTYEYYVYKDSINWPHYLNGLMNRIEINGI